MRFMRCVRLADGPEERACKHPSQSSRQAAGDRSAAGKEMLSMDSGIERLGRTDSLIHAPRPAMSCNSRSVRAQTGRFRAEPMKPARDRDEDTPARGTW